MFSRIFLLLLPLLLFSCQMSRPAHRPGPAQLQARLMEAVKDFRGRVGFYVEHLGSGEKAEFCADDLFPTASMIKVPILVTLFDAIEAGRVDYEAELQYEASRLYPGNDLLGSFRDGESISIPKLILLMETLSDNTASLWLQELAGTGTAINAWLAAHGFEKIRMNSRTPGRKPDWERYGWGQCSPREMAGLLRMIREGKAGTAWASYRMRRALARSFWDGRALAAIPPEYEVLSKQGAVSDSRSEVILVHAPGGDYVACFTTDDQADRSWRKDNEGYVLLRKLSRICWQHFEAGHPWSRPISTASKVSP